MRDKVLQHAGSLLGGIVHNLNTPLMWVMGRSQLMDARNENLEEIIARGEEDILKLKEKNAKDIRSISDGAEKIDYILKGVGYKIQMATEGLASLELRDYLKMETGFLMGDMRFKHETKTDFAFENAKSCYVHVDYNSLSWAVVSVIDVILENTDKGRTIKIDLIEGRILISCPELNLEAVRDDLKTAMAGLDGLAECEIGMEGGVAIRIKDAK